MIQLSEHVEKQLQEILEDQQEKPKSTVRNRGYYRKQAFRLKQKRTKEVKQILGKQEFFRLVENNALTGIENRHVLGCSCDMCKFEKHYSIESAKYKRKRLRLEQSLHEYDLDSEEE
ncbi:hypothetical protein JK635_07315 [Neobacillus sp. YIM B02564]|uniref:Transposase n=1 Tax=Neobacillus paridis TaxID=2803862 RepID=A0ABS1TL79_9BACI|nr:hypothetical protein [Neobacillus paridis]MBL4952017.1 hypothetical protein [Neobacillus paridis]